ncbi:stretch-activated Ca2+-permeable channel component-domain-containing protein [Gongronella butleri]|nr:stretch-activated Ca2+-permeable channel component-domain-containing protein [Gongronella butleri]
MAVPILLLIFGVFMVVPVLGQPNNTIPLQNNKIASFNLTAGQQQAFYFQTSQQALLAKRATPVFLTISTCVQPTGPAHIPALQLYLSTSSSNTLPSPTHHDPALIDQLPGYLAWNTSDTAEVWFSVVAPQATDIQGQWQYQVGISTAGLMQPVYNVGQLATLDDTDTTNALFLSAPYASNANFNITPLLAVNIPIELTASYCAAQLHQVPSLSINVSQTRRDVQDASTLQQQIMVSNLTIGQTYSVYFAQQLAGGIQAMQLPLTARMKTDSRCRLIHDLSFCDHVAYSVLADATQDIKNISQSYDTYASGLYQPFATAISQFNCNTTQYSLVRNCLDCERDYKRWLCAVTIPRCTDNDNATNAATYTYGAGSARNDWIQQTYNPNGYTEMLPCIDLCYQVVQSCPPFLQFSCPTDDLATLQYGYWLTKNNTNNPSCNRVDLTPALLVISDASKRATMASTMALLPVVLSTSLLLLLA